MPVVDLPGTGAHVDVFVGSEVVAGRVTQLRSSGLVIELAAEPAVTEPLRLYWQGSAGVRTELARVALRWPVRTGVRWHVLPAVDDGSANRRDAVRASLRLKVQLTDRVSGAVFRGRTVDVSESGLRCRLDVAAVAPSEAALVDVGLTLRGAVFPLPGQLRTVIGDEDGWDVAVAFTDLADSLADLLRAQVFAALREQRRLSLL